MQDQAQQIMFAMIFNYQTYTSLLTFITIQCLSKQRSGTYHTVAILEYYPNIQYFV